jgi:hypothetical protein
MRKRMLLAVAAVLMTFSAHAHHSLDPRGWPRIEWPATIEFISWDGAHVMYRVRVDNERGESQSWQVLGASPKILASRNIRKSTLARGEHITVIGFLDPASKIIAPEWFVASDGRRYEMGFYPPSMAKAAASDAR